MEYAKEYLAQLYNIIAGTNMSVDEIIQKSLRRTGSLEESLRRLIHGENPR